MLLIQNQSPDDQIDLALHQLLTDPQGGRLFKNF